MADYSQHDYLHPDETDRMSDQRRAFLEYKRRVGLYGKPFFPNGVYHDVIAANARHGIATEAWSPLAQGAVLRDPAVVAIAEAHGVSPAQAVLRWHLQQDRIVIPKSVTPSRIAENFDVFGFDLTADELGAIDALERDGRTGPHPDEFHAA